MASKHWSAIMILLTLSFLITLLDNNFDQTLPSIVSILPPLIAIASAFILRQVIVALFLGIWFGAWAIAGRSLESTVIGLLDIPQKYTLTVMTKTENIAIILITLLISGMVGVISSNGGMVGLLEHIVKWAKNRKRVQLSTIFMGLIIFFDDYSNTLIVGNTMRPITDKVKISREKLAYLVDSTAAPIASVALVSLWIGYQVGLIETAISNIASLHEPYIIFLNSLAYSFYPILTLCFVFFVVLTGKDFGPMLTAEKRAITGDIAGRAPKTNNNTTIKRSSALNALIPILMLIITVILGILITGEGNTIREILGSANSITALLLAGFIASIIAIVMTQVQKLQSLEETIKAWTDGLSTVTTALVILVLSWVLAEITKELHTADYLVSIISDSIYPAIFPALIFILAGVISLGTGTSWGTMGILMPIVIPLSYGLISNEAGNVNPEDMHIIYSSISCVLAGSVWGDHCSPISDTTILSSMASQCNHVDHVRTQMPYALTVGAVSVIIGTLATGFGMPWWFVFIFAIAILWFGLNKFGQLSQ